MFYRRGINIYELFKNFFLLKFQIWFMRGWSKRKIIIKQHIDWLKKAAKQERYRKIIKNTAYLNTYDESYWDSFVFLTLELPRMISFWFLLIFTTDCLEGNLDYTLHTLLFCISTKLTSSVLLNSLHFLDIFFSRLPLLLFLMAVYSSQSSRNSGTSYCLIFFNNVILHFV